MHKVILLFVVVSISACSGATSTGGKARSPSPASAGAIDIQLPAGERVLVEAALACLNESDKEFVELHTARVIPGSQTVANLDTGATVIAPAHLHMGDVGLGAVLVHEACHHWQWYAGKVANGAAAENECNSMQAEAQMRARG